MALGSFRSVETEPINIFRIAVMKNASRVIAVHNHPSGSLHPSEADLDITDRLIQVGRILNIEFVDHLIITPVAYLSFRGERLMDELEKSLKYVPTYQIIEKIRKEERKISREKLELEKGKTRTARDATKTEREQKEKLIQFLQEKEIPVEQIADILSIAPKDVQRMLSRKK